MAQLTQEEEIVREAPLGFAGKTSTYAGKLTAPNPGHYTLQVLAMDRDNINYGWVKKKITVARSNE